LKLRHSFESRMGAELQLDGACNDYNGK